MEAARARCSLCNSCAAFFPEMLKPGADEEGCTFCPSKGGESKQLLLCVTLTLLGGGKKDFSYFYIYNMVWSDYIGVDHLKSLYYDTTTFWTFVDVS